MINIEDVQLSIISLIRIIEDDQNYQHYQYVSGASTLSEQLILVECSQLNKPPLKSLVR